MMMVLNIIIIIIYDVLPIGFMVLVNEIMKILVYIVLKHPFFKKIMYIKTMNVFCTFTIFLIELFP